MGKRNTKELYKRRDELLCKLWITYRNMSDIISADEFADDDLAIWEMITRHEAIQSRIDKAIYIQKMLDTTNTH